MSKLHENVARRLWETQPEVARAAGIPRPSGAKAPTPTAQALGIIGAPCEGTAAVGAVTVGKKHGNRIQVVDGIRWDSELERRCWEALAQRYGKERVLRQIGFPIYGRRSMKWDFALFSITNGKRTLEAVLDSKGFERRDWRGKLLEFEELYPWLPVHLLKKPDDVWGLPYPGAGQFEP